MRQGRHGKGVFLAFRGEKGREPKTPAVRLRNRCCVVTPDPIATQGRSSGGASEGEERLSAATPAAYQVLLKYRTAGRILRPDGLTDFFAAGRANERTSGRPDLAAWRHVLMRHFFA